MEAWVDDDLGLPVPGAEVELTGPDSALRQRTDRYGTVRLEQALPQARHFRTSVSSNMDLHRKSGELCMKQEDLHAEDPFYERVPG